MLLLILPLGCTVDADIAALQARVDTLQADQEATALALRAEIDAIEARTDALEARADALEIDVADLRSELDAARVDDAALAGRVDQLATDLDSLEAANAALSDRVTTTEADLSSLTTTVSGVEGRLATAETNIGDLDLRVTDVETDVSTLDASLSVLDTRVLLVETDLAILAADLLALDARVGTLETDLADLDTRLSAAEDGLAALDLPATCVVQAGESIQACVDTVLALGGGTVEIAEGTFVLSAHVHVWGSNLILRGRGCATRLYVDDAVDQAAILIGDDANPTSSSATVENVLVEHLCIDGNKAGQTSETYLDPAYTHLRVNGVTVRNAADVVLRDLTIERARSGGVVTADGVSGLVVDHVVSREHELDGVALYLTTDSVITGCLLTDNSAAGITADIANARILVVNNLVLDNGAGESGTETNPGIYLGAFADSLVSDNLVSGTAGDGIHLTDTGYGGATGNVFADNVLAENGGAAVSITQTTCTGNVGHGNCYRDNGTVLYDVDSATTSERYADTDALCD